MDSMDAMDAFDSMDSIRSDASMDSITDSIETVLVASFPLVSSRSLVLSSTRVVECRRRRSTVAVMDDDARARGCVRRWAISMVEYVCPCVVRSR